MHIYVENQRGERFLVSEGWSSSPTVFDNDFSADLLATFSPAILDQIFDRFLAHSALVSSFGHAELTQDLLHTQQFPGLPTHFSRDHIEVYTAVRQRRILVEEAPLGEPVLDERQTSLRSRIRMALQKIIAEERAEAARIDAVHQKRNELEKLGAQVSQVAKGLGQAGWDLVVWTKDIAEVALLVNPIRMQTQLASATYDYYAHDKSFEASSREYMGKVKKEIVDVLGFDPSTITVEQLEQAFEIAHLVYDDDGLRSDISRFAKDYVKAQHSLEISEFAGGGVFEIILTIVLAAFTGGVGGAAAMAKNARLMFRFKDVGDLILDFAKYQKQRKRLSKTRGAKSEGTSFKTLKSEEVSVPQSPASDAPASKPAGAKKSKGNDKGAKDKDAEKKAKATNAKDRSNEDTGVNGDGKTTQCNGKACESGEPINLKTGEERLTLVDAVLDGPLPLTVARTYRSSNHADSGMGVGWSHTLGEKLLVHKGKGIVELHDAEGRRISLPLPGESDRSHNVVEQLSVTRHGEDHWVISPYGAPEGVQKHFRPQGQGQSALLLSEIRDGYDNFHRFHYVNGQLICVESSLGEALHITPSDGRIGELQKETRDGRLSSLASYAYSEQGDLVRATDADGHSEEYAYQGHLISQRKLKSGYRFHFQWDDTGPGARCLRQWGDPIDGQATYDYSFVWDDDGHGVAVTDTRGGTERYRFNDRGLPIYYRDAEGGETLYTYNALGQTLSIQLPAETGITREEHYEYDSRGRLIRKTDAAGGEQRIEYSPAGLPAKIIDGAGRSWQREYNASGQVVATIDPLGNTTRYSYNPIGLVGSVTDPLDNTTRYLWNPQGKLSAVQDPEGRATHYKYDIQQRLVEVQHGADLRTGYEYDAQDRISAIINPDGARTEYRYNPQGLVAEIIDPEGRSTRYSYDGLSQVKSRTNPDGSELQYLYDGERNLVGLINEKGERYQLKYDLNERLTEEVGFDGRITRYAYNKAGHLVASRAVTDPASGQGIDTLFERDPFGRLLQETTPDSITSFRYNKAGQMVEADNGHRKLRWEYDPAGRMVADWQDKAKITHRYDAAGNRIATVLPDGEELRIGHNAAGQFESLHRLPAGGDTEQLLTRISRNELGREIRRQHGNGLATESDYDPQGRLHKLRVAKADDPLESPTPDRPLLERTYGYNRSGQLTRIADSLRGTRNYHYDALDRLTLVEGPNPEHFVHDPASNILAAAGSAEEAKEQAGSAQISGNRLKFRGDTHYEYDVHGNRVAALRGKGQKLQTRYRYNSKHQLIVIAHYRVNDAGEPELQSETLYQYDPLGRRISKRGAQESTEFLWNEDVLLQETTRDIATAQDLKARTYYFEPETFKPLALGENGEVYHYHLDHLGTPDALTNASSDVVWNVSYKSYGNVADAHRQDITQPIRFQGQYWDDESGLHYNRFRFFDTELGEYITQDPVGLFGGTNNYRYGPNPNGWTDPLGLSCKEAQVHVAYRSNKPVGHNYIGITLPGQKTQWFDLVITEDAGGVMGLVRGGQSTMLRHGSNISKKTKISTRNVDFDQARSMLLKADDLSFSDTGPYHLLKNSCTSAVCDILKAGGVNPPWWAKTPKLIFEWF